MGAIGASWEQIVGQPLAAHTTPAKLVGERLTVIVDRPVWAAQVKLMAEEICRSVGDCVGVKVTSLEVSVNAD